MTAIAIKQINSKSDLSDLVSLNRNDSDTYDASRPQEWLQLSFLERWRHGGLWLNRHTLSLHLEILEEAGGIILIARTAELLVGELELLFEDQTRDSPRAFITWMVVHPRFRHRGIGSELISHARQLVRNRGGSQLLTTVENSDAVHFFVANKFQIIDQVAAFSKTLKPFHKPHSFKLQQIPLQWKQRKHTPMGFVPSIGINFTSEYIWSYLRHTNQFYKLLAIDAPRPSLWLLRQGEKEALTVDYPFIHIWLAETIAQDADFLKSVLTTTEYLSWKNGVTQLSAFSQKDQYEFFKERGYQLKQEQPFLTLSW